MGGALPTRPPRVPAADSGAPRPGGPRHAGGAGPAAYRIGRGVFAAAVRVYFRCIEVRGLERVPGHGPLLIVANHPSAMTDALVLATALTRPIHFLAMSPLFQPRIRGVLMRAVGTLPVYRREDDPTLTARNETTFAACHEFLDRGEVVLLFPEGRSDTDRRVVQIKTGAARLAIAQEGRLSAGSPLTLLPVGLYFEDRTRFQSEVILSVGDPIPLGAFVARATTEPREAVVALTAEIQQAIESLIQVIEEPEAQDLVEELERLYMQVLRVRGDPRHELELRQRVSECVEYFRRADPERVVAVSRQLACYRRKLQALHLEDAALRELETSEHWRRSHLTRFVLACVGSPFALAGAVLHWLPFETCGWIARRLAPHPMLMSSIHILAGVVIFPVWLFALGGVLGKLTHWPVAGLVLVVSLAAGLGVFAGAYFEWWERQPGFLRLPLLALRKRRMLARVRLERNELIRVFDHAREDFLAATRPDSGGEAPA